MKKGQMYLLLWAEPGGSEVSLYSNRRGHRRRIVYKELTRLVDPQNTILLISATKMIKETKSVLKMTEILEDLMVYEKKPTAFN